MLANSLVGCLHRELLQVLTCQDPSFKNEVIGALFSSLDLLFIEIPVDELVTYPPAQQPLQSPGALACRTATISSAKGRTGNELLVDINTGMSTPKLVAVHYTKLLRHASLDALLVLAEKLDEKCKAFTGGNKRPPSPYSQAVMTLQQVARAASQRCSGPLSPRGPCTP